MNRHDRHVLDEIARQLVAQDPELAARLTGPVDRLMLVARRIGRLMLVAGAVMLLVGDMGSIDAMTGIGVALVATFWLPPLIAREESRSRRRGAKPWDMGW